MKDLKQASARGVAWNLAQNLAGRALSLAVVAILARLIDRAAFGTLAIANVVTLFAELLVSQGYGAYIAQNPNLSDEHTNAAFWLNTTLGVVLTITIIIAAEPLASVLVDDASVAPFMRWLSLSLLLESLQVVPTGLLVREMRFRQLSLRNLLAASVGGVVGIVCAISGLGIYSLVIQSLVGDVVATVALWRVTTWRPTPRFRTAHLRELSRFSAPIFGGSVLNFAIRRLDVVIIGRELGLIPLAVYSLGLRVFQIANQILNKSSDAVTMSALAKLTDEDERRRALYAVTEITAALCFPIYAGLAVAAAPLISTLFGDRWTDSAPVLTLFGAAGIPLSLSYMHGAALKAAAATRGFFVIQLVLAVVYLPGLLIVVSNGVVVAAATYLVALCILLPVEISMMKSALGISVQRYVRALIGPIVATSAMVAMTLAVGELAGSVISALRILIETVTGLVSYLVALRVLAPATFLRLRGAVLTLRRRS